jgi:DNA-binding response OmpR family regulator
VKKQKYSITLDGDPGVSGLISGFTQLESLAFSCGDELMINAHDLDPIAVFVDLHLGGRSRGLELLPQIRACWPVAAVLVVTSDQDPELVGHALAAGANDFLRKPIVREELLARLKARLIEMGLRHSGDFLDAGLGRFNVRRRFLEGPGGTIYLSPLQSELLRLLLESGGTLVPKESVKREIWGKLAVTDNALDRRLSELRRILKDSGTEMQLVTEYGKGISLQSRVASRSAVRLRTA